MTAEPKMSEIMKELSEIAFRHPNRPSEALTSLRFFANAA
jgi:hypothetical protein